MTTERGDHHRWPGSVPEGTHSNVSSVLALILLAPCPSRQKVTRTALLAACHRLSARGSYTPPRTRTVRLLPPSSHLCGVRAKYEASAKHARPSGVVCYPAPRMYPLFCTYVGTGAGDAPVAYELRSLGFTIGLDVELGLSCSPLMHGYRCVLSQACEAQGWCAW